MLLSTQDLPLLPAHMIIRCYAITLPARVIIRFCIMTNQFFLLSTLKTFTYLTPKTVRWAASLKLIWMSCPSYLWISKPHLLLLLLLTSWTNGQCPQGQGRITLMALCSVRNRLSKPQEQGSKQHSSIASSFLPWHSSVMDHYLTVYFEINLFLPKFLKSWCFITIISLDRTLRKTFSLNSH